MLERVLTKGQSITLLNASAHPPMRILSIQLILEQVPDAAATTITGDVQTLGATILTGVLTFTQGTDIVGGMKAATISAGKNLIPVVNDITLVTAGTTATAGSILYIIQFENV